MGRRVRPDRPKPWFLVALVTATIGVTGCGSSAERARPVGALPPGSGVIPIQGLSSRAGPAVAWTGTELFVFGGLGSGTEGDPARLLTDGATVDPATGRADRLPGAPFPAPLLTSDAALIAPGQVLVLGWFCPSPQPYPDSDSYECGSAAGLAGAVLDTDARDWTKVKVPKLDAQPSQVRIVGTTSNGDVVVGIGRPNDLRRDYWRFRADSGDGSWTELGSPGVATDACLAGDTLVALTAKFDNGGQVLEQDPRLVPAPGSGAVYVPGDAAWVEPTFVTRDPSRTDGAWSPDLTLTDARYPIPPEISCMGGEVMVVPGGSDGSEGTHVYSVARNTVRRPSAPPKTTDAGFAGFFAPRVVTGTELLFLTRSPDFAAAPTPGQVPGLLPSRAYDPGSDTWRVLAPLPGATADPQWTGSALVDYAAAFTGMGSGEGRGLFYYHPVPVDAQTTASAGDPGASAG